MVGQKYFKRGEGANERLGGQKYTKYNKLNNKSEKFRMGQDCCQEWLRPMAPLSCGHVKWIILVVSPKNGKRWGLLL